MTCSEKDGHGDSLNSVVFELLFQAHFSLSIKYYKFPFSLETKTVPQQYNFNIYMSEQVLNQNTKGKAPTQLLNHIQLYNDFIITLS